MTLTYQWLKTQSSKVSNNTLFIDAEKTVTYADNLAIVTRLINFFHRKNLALGAKIVYVENHSPLHILSDLLNP
jgi:hypothetical protein